MIDKECFLEPVGSRLVVKRDQFKYSGLIAIPDKAKEPPTTGTVVKAGPGLEDYVGKRVLWNFLSGSPVTFRNKPSYTVLNIEEVLAIITTDEKLEPSTKEFVEM